MKKERKKNRLNYLTELSEDQMSYVSRVVQECLTPKCWLLLTLRLLRHCTFQASYVTFGTNLASDSKRNSGAKRPHRTGAALSLKALGFCEELREVI